MAITFVKNEKIILITSPQTVVTIQELLNEIRKYEDEWYAMDAPALAKASGKEDLGGGVLVGITLELLDGWRVKFEDRCELVCNDPSYTGDSFVQCSITGGNIVTTNEYNNTAVAPSGCTQVIITSSSSATIAELEIANLQRLIETQRPSHVGTGNIYYWDPYAGSDAFDARSPDSPGQTFSYVQSLVSDYNNDIIIAQPGYIDGPTITTERIVVTKNNLFIRGPGSNFRLIPDDVVDFPTVMIMGEGVEFSNLYVSAPFDPSSSYAEPNPSDAHSHNYSDGIHIHGNNVLLKNIFINGSGRHGIYIKGSENTNFDNIKSVNAVSDGFFISEFVSSLDFKNCSANNCGRDGIGSEGDGIENVLITGEETAFYSNGRYGIYLSSNVSNTVLDTSITVQGNENGNIMDLGLNTRYSGIDYMQNYNDEVELNTASSFFGTNYPRGTHSMQVNNLLDAIAIAAENGLSSIMITGDVVATDIHNLFNLIIKGNAADASITLNGANTTGVIFQDIGVRGNCLGKCDMNNASIYGPLTNFFGRMIKCSIISTITLGSYYIPSAFLDCYGFSSTTIDFAGSASNAFINNFHGNLSVANVVNENSVRLSFNEGTCRILNTCDSGTINVEGVVRVYDASLEGCFVDQNSTINKAHTDQIRRLVELQRREHVGLGLVYYWDPYGGDDSLDGQSATTAVKTFLKVQDKASSGNNDVIICMSSDPSGITSVYENMVVTKDDLLIRSTGTSFNLYPLDPNEPTVKFLAKGCQLQGMRVTGSDYGYQNVIEVFNDGISLDTLWIEHGRMHGVYLRNTRHSEIRNCVIESCGGYFLDPSYREDPSDIVDPSNLDISEYGNGILLGFNTKENLIINSTTWHNQGCGICFGSEGGCCEANKIHDTDVFNNDMYGIYIKEDTEDTVISSGCTIYGNIQENIQDESNYTNYTGLNNASYYNDIVILDTINGVSGVNYPRGTSSLPSNNITDALAIAENNHLSTLKFYNNITALPIHNLKNKIIRGVGYVTITLAGAITDFAKFEECVVTGDMNGACKGDRASLFNITNLNGSFFGCGFAPGVNTIASGAEIIFVDCFSQVPGSGTPVLDCNAGNPGNINNRGYKGGLQIINFDEPTQKMTIDMLSGNTKISSSCTEGQIVLRGTGMYSDDSGQNCEVIVEGLSYLGVIAYNGVVMVDTSNPSADSTGNLYPIGTSGHPVDNMIDAKIIADRNHINTFNIYGDVTLEEDLYGYVFMAHSPDVVSINLNGQIISNSTFQNAKIRGYGTGRFRALDCEFDTGFPQDMDCQLENCILNGTFIAASGATINGDRCSSPSFCSFDLNMTGNLGFANFSGVLEISNQNYAGGVVGVTGYYLLTLDTSLVLNYNTLISGIGILINKSQPSYSVVEKTLPSSVWNEVQSSHLASGTVGESLSNASVGGDVNQIASAVWEKLADPSSVVIGSFGDELVNRTTDVNAEEIADAVWEETSTAHNDVGTMGNLQNTAGSGGVDYNSLADAVWNEDITTHTNADSAGEKLEEASQGGDPTTTADAVWDKMINESEQVPGSYGEEITNISDNIGTISDESLFSLNTTVDAPIVDFDNIQFTIAEGTLINDTYNNCIIAIVDASDGHIEVRRIDDYIGVTKEITLDRALSFNVEHGDTINISRVAYGGATGTGSSGGPKLDD
ncbi:MAG: right-handed parallel beta-helix repeat-containing protein [Clostridiales bacterium]|nr:right-handed parallel beta-helix repeat-containing protein [Clostridiales bacterium]